MSEHTYETAVKRLQEIVKTLENGGLPLDESVKLFEEGAGLAKFCNNELKNAEQRIIALEDIDGGEQ
ncbi:MAG: exodeoxyribonuclease VII small subunit [Ruminococcaceae bacterium]|nr:exodeoxyribonuclease VII small subunit [Oscillospiraceae bacterium]MBR3597477.1 exodeoxyribonuclease VII small subunit [Clostridia bacterium]